MARSDFTYIPVPLTLAKDADTAVAKVKVRGVQKYKSRTDFFIQSAQEQLDRLKIMEVKA